VETQENAVTDLISYSFSRIESYENCPRKFWHESVAKTIPFEKNEAAQYGDDVHKAFATFFMDGKKLPLHLLHYQPFLELIKSAPGDKIIEQKICLNAKYEPVEWYAKDAYIRVISDLTQVSGTRGVVWDWKTGRPKDDFTQLQLNAAITFHLDPSIEEMTMAYFWLKTKSVATEKMVRGQVPDFWSGWMPRVQKYQDAHVQQNFPPRQNFLCKGFCKVKSCQFWETKR
jgi:hypothetical protein